MFPHLVAVAALCALAMPALSQSKAPQPKAQKAPESENHFTRVYKQVGKRGLKLVIDTPTDWKPTDKRPALVMFYGGGWVAGKPVQFDTHMRHFAKLGLVGIQVEYRLLRKPTDTPLVPIQDAKSAMRWVRSHAAELGIDPDRIAAGGGSAGGHLAAFTSMVEGKDDPADDLTVSPRAQALLLFNPAYDNGPTGFAYSRVGERYREFSPVHNVTKDAPPSIVFLGTNDNLIPVATAEKFKADMEKVGVRSDLFLYEGGVHGFFNKPPYLQQTIAETEKFLRSLGWIENKAPMKANEFAARENCRPAPTRCNSQNEE